MKRRYFILERVSESEFNALEVCIGEMYTQIYSSDGGKLFIKTNNYLINKNLDGDISTLGVEYDFNEWSDILNKDI